jgi:hypothetical protein
MICIPKLALEIQDISLLALLLLPRLDAIPQDVTLYVFGRWCLVKGHSVLDDGLEGGARQRVATKAKISDNCTVAREEGP